MELILASGSPRRRELLRLLGVPFVVRAADVDETPRPYELPAVLAERLARAKARWVAEREPQAIAIAADTVVSLGRELYGKPGGADDARAMLRRLAGHAHRVTTAVAVASGGQVWARTKATRVWMRPWDERRIDEYVATGDPLDKAGAYAVQNEQFRPVARLHGCRCNVVGFPLGVVAGLLREAGVEVQVRCPYGQRAGCYLA